MLFTVAGSVAMPAQMISLEEAGLEQRADLQEWVLSNPAILGPAIKIVTFEFDGLPAAGGAARDRVSVLGLGADGRLIVAELKSSRATDTEVSAIKYAAAVSRMLPESLADHYARFQSRRQTPKRRWPSCSPTHPTSRRSPCASRALCCWRGTSRPW